MPCFNCEEGRDTYRQYVQNNIHLYLYFHGTILVDVQLRFSSGVSLRPFFLSMFVCRCRGLLCAYCTYLFIYENVFIAPVYVCSFERTISQEQVPPPCRPSLPPCALLISCVTSELKGSPQPLIGACLLSPEPFTGHRFLPRVR